MRLSTRPPRTSAAEQSRRLHVSGPQGHPRSPSDPVGYCGSTPSARGGEQTSLCSPRSAAADSGVTAKRSPQSSSAMVRWSTASRACHTSAMLNSATSTVGRQVGQCAPKASSPFVRTCRWSCTRHQAPGTRHQAPGTRRRARQRAAHAPTGPVPGLDRTARRQCTRGCESAQDLQAKVQGAHQYCHLVSRRRWERDWQQRLLDDKVRGAHRAHGAGADRSPQRARRHYLPTRDHARTALRCTLDGAPTGRPRKSGPDLVQTYQIEAMPAFEVPPGP
jgi:hypothetical protein